MKFLVFDLEGDGLYPSKIHCFCGKDPYKETDVKATTNHDTIRKVLSSVDVLIGHNITRFDIPVIERLLGVDLSDKKLIDTLALSWYLYPERIKHGLEEWGEEFGVPKPKINDWYNLSTKEYIHRCSEDVKINTKLFHKQWDYLMSIYQSEEGVWRLIDYLQFKMDCAREQERSGWKLDVERAKSVLEKFNKEIGEKEVLLADAMPEVPVWNYKIRPAKPYKKDGSLSVTGAKWFNLLKEQGLPEDYDGEVKNIIKHKEPNPNSTDQIKDWLFSLGWKPCTFKFDKNPDGSVRKIPQVRMDSDEGKVLTPSVVSLIEKEPALEHLQGLTVLQHRRSIIKGFLENVDENGYIKAEVGGFTNTLRFKHRVIVNLPGVDKPYGDDIRGCLIAPEGYELCGSDMSSLEDRTKQHYMWDYDPDFVREMQKPDFDPHLDLALTAKELTEEQVQAYKDGDKTHKPIRSQYKVVNYACTYGAGAARIAREVGGDKKKAEQLVKTYWERNWSLDAIAKNCEVKKVNGQQWLYNPVAQLWYSLRHDKDRFSTLNQGTGAYCFDRWLQYVRSQRPQLTGQFHDEFILCIKKGCRDKAEKLLQWAIEKVNEDLKLNRRLDIDVQFGDNYASIH